MKDSKMKHSGTRQHGTIRSNNYRISFFLSFFFFLSLLTKSYIQMYCHVQREQDNNAQITGTNSCPLSLNHRYRYKYNAVHFSAFSISKNSVKSTFLRFVYANDEKSTTRCRLL